MPKSYQEIWGEPGHASIPEHMLSEYEVTVQHDNGYIETVTVLMASRNEWMERVKRVVALRNDWNENKFKIMYWGLVDEETDE